MGINPFSVFLPDYFGQKKYVILGITQQFLLLQLTDSYNFE